MLSHLAAKCMASFVISDIGNHVSNIFTSIAYIYVVDLLNIHLLLIDR